MKALRTIVIISALVGSLAAAPAAMAAGKAPAGHGLFPLTGQDDIQITNLICDDPTITEFHVARGGLAAWVPGGSDADRLYVLTSVSGETTVGGETYPFEQHYGRKAGKSTTIACSMDFAFGFGEVTGVMNITAVRIW
jgi:hypothetical protein